MNDIIRTAGSEFSDFTNAVEGVRAAIRMTVSIVLGGLLGYERENSGKSAGMRTHMLVALGACLFVVVALQAGVQLADMSRVLQGLTSGIGFLCAGAILKPDNDEAHVKGLTTAASIWIAAAIGVAAGMGHAMTAGIATAIALIVLRALQISRK
ncbi:MAG: methyltransferase [Cupriavidus sp.]|uniref:MgtC/SapB family protein n=1 Tax=Cupriavidus pauculus TaxID=82633 RepID=UPI000C6A5607|nr:MgtC/SapB family protein [Cupriavidus pauculus]KAB0600415.1 MgtC/SapB family protein [Cupriavidus pauculus]MBU68018.1 methyltransferase [Cupriavidus sp.]MBY4733413.1 MgtC/SapB family protein [Cupriavidus pauculus]UAL03847.1 MgtC/SapB family protein [Cupriavidus pauculus]